MNNLNEAGSLDERLSPKNVILGSKVMDADLLEPYRRLLSAICDENLNVYRASPQRLSEDIGQEDQIATDYRGRLVYELLQNADDAMVDSAGKARICFLLTDDELWVANSGRPLTEADIRGLCGISASSKTATVGRKRATIGHKGMGFKSVLEITEAPEVYSATVSFRFSQEEALQALGVLVSAGIVRAPSRAPVSRFPRELADDNRAWRDFAVRGMKTAFRFPFRKEFPPEKIESLEKALTDFPVTSLVFLKHVAEVEVRVERLASRHEHCWSVVRKDEAAGGKEVDSYAVSGIYEISLRSDTRASYFLMAHNAEISIDNHRGGLAGFSWEGVDITEVSVAVPLDNGLPTSLAAERKKFHVFLPTGEKCPFNMLVNGAFSCNLSRQEIRVEEEDGNYNRFLLGEAAHLFCRHLLPALKERGADTASTIGILKRDEPPGIRCLTEAAQCFYESIRTTLGSYDLVPLESGELVPIPEIIVPPPAKDGATGISFRKVLSREARFGNHHFPVAPLCASQVAVVLVDMGARCLNPMEVASVLANASPERSKLHFHPSDKFWVDPVLEVLGKVCMGSPPDFRRALAAAVRELPLFPVSVTVDDAVQRVATKEVTCFYPPRSLRGSVPLVGLEFMMQELCWGDLTANERNLYLKDEMPIWQELFDIREFKFPEVMRASVLPSLDLDRADSSEHDDTGMPTLHRLAAICQLSGRTPNRNAPLPYERLGTSRALFNLSRLHVPCRGEGDSDFVWAPAYQVYFGEDWVGEGSAEKVLQAVGEATTENPPNLKFLVGPEKFTGLLERYSHLRAVAADAEADSDEVGLDEDEDAPLDDSARVRWLDFFQWLGVNRGLRPVHFHDVEERAAGWLRTSGLRKPEGWIFQHVPPQVWEDFLAPIRNCLERNRERFTATVPFFYHLHDLEHLVVLLQLSEADASATIAQALFKHLALNWTVLERFSKVKIAQVSRDQAPGMRTKPPRARADELSEAGDDFWVYRLRQSAFCPTGHGPRRPNQVWLPTSEVRRRFGRRGMEQAGYLIPVLALESFILSSKGQSFALTLRLRPELGPESFTVEDARSLLDRIAGLYRQSFAADVPPTSLLKEVIRPAYRELIDLLTGKDRERNQDDLWPLADAPVLAHDGDKTYEFKPAKEIFYLERRDTRERLQTDSPVWCFALEAHPAAAAPLAQLFGMKTLEDSLQWEPCPGEAALSPEDLTVFRERLKELAPYLLARIGTERSDQRAARQDRKAMRGFIETVEPVITLAVGCALGGGGIQSEKATRDSFVLRENGEIRLAFVVWGENPWPPTPEDADKLATALCEIYGASYYESFLALIANTSPHARKKLLKRSGASLELDEGWLGDDYCAEDEVEPISNASAPELKTAATQNGADRERVPQGPGSRSRSSEDPKPTVPLYAPRQLSINGTPVILTGTRLPAPDPSAGGGQNGGRGGGNGGGAYGGYTDLTELDMLGMYVAMTYECSRLKGGGVPLARIFDPALQKEQPDAVVFDVSNPARIELAQKYSPAFARSMARLKERHGISYEWPGFDILSIDPRLEQEYDRLIELKSSGVAARTQGMSWNEWKSAQHSALRARFYLYLVGNLRSDLEEAPPFIRTIRNPFQQMEAKVVEERVLRQTIQLSVNFFESAEHLDLTVTS